MTICTIKGLRSGPDTIALGKMILPVFYDNISPIPYTSIMGGC